AVLLGIVAVLGVVGGAAFLFGGGDDGGGGATAAAAFDATYQQVMQLDGECRFDEALSALQSLVATAKGPQRETAQQQLRNIELRKKRFADGKTELDALRRRVSADFRGESRGDVGRFIDRHGDLRPLVDQAEKLLVDLDERAKKPSPLAGIELDDLRLPADPTVANCIAEADKWLAKEEFAKAHFLLTRVTAADDGEQRQLDAALARVNAAARKLGQEILDRVEEQLKAGHVLVAIGEFDDDNMRPFKGTDIWYEMLDKADQIEDLIDQRYAQRPFPRRKHHRDKPGTEKKTSFADISDDFLAGRQPAGGATTRGAMSAGRTAEPPEAARPGAAAAAAIEQARALLVAGDFAAARDLLDTALVGASDPAVKQEIAREHERAARPAKLAQRVVELLAQKLPGNCDVTLRGGRKARVTGSDGQQLMLQAGGSTFTAAPGELAATALLELSGRLPLQAEEQLDRAFLALATGDDKAFFGAIGKAADGAAAKGSIDSALAYQRRLDRVPARGFVRVADGWRTWEERAREELAAELKAALATVLDRKGDPSAVRLRFMELAAAAPADALEQVRARRSELKRAFEQAPDQARIAKLAEKAEQLAAARQHALELIFDEVKYFYPYRPPAVAPERAMEYAAAQQEVDRRVNAVRELWGREEAVPPEPPEPHVPLTSGFMATLEELKLLRSLLVDLGAANDDDDRALRLAWALPTRTKTLHVRNFARDEFERARLDEDLRVATLNASQVVRDDGPSREEYEQVRVTNQYRAMLGRRMLAHNDKLWEASDSHSRWMAKTGRLSHFEDDDPERASPEQRMRLAGYTSGAGENCAVGSSGPLEVLIGWCHSSGHHRNLLYDSHTEMGAGQSGSYWTQCFGGGREYKGNLIRD
ncbi:MAG: CAP domain-containing protein, partial [Planctomycetes bacterium]|nr:CAP domain-containing protein [Planctomycetota bacterium]